MDNLLAALPETYRDIPLPSGLISLERVEKGWSREYKFRLVMYGGVQLLLRIRDGAQEEKHHLEYDFVRSLSSRGLSVPRPHAFGPAGGGQGSYMLLDWVTGADLIDALPGLPVGDQYRLGQSAGEMLRAIHQTPVPEGALPVGSMKSKALHKTKRFEDAGFFVRGGTRMTRYIKENIDKLDREAPVTQHGDFHPGNLVYTPEGRIAAIDFNRWGVGDPVEEFYKLQSFTIENSIPFACGQIDGYFPEGVPLSFWEGLAVHVAVSSLYSILWAAPFGPDEVEDMVRRCERAFADYQGFDALIPAWYMQFGGESDARQAQG